MATRMMLSHDEIPEVFSDVTPIPQDDGPNPVCAIDYSPQFIQVYDYMRAILVTGEKSERALKLTGLCLKLNPANYTIWHFRRQCVDEIIASDNITQIIQQDLELAAGLGGANPKNYQIWYHRRALLESAAKRNGHDMSAYIPAELDYVAAVLGQDSKNYHAWSHRQWVVRASKETILWEKELEFAHFLIQRDPRNNSAWNQRWFVCHQGGTIESMPLHTAKKEADYAIQGAARDPYNESPWRYLIGILKEQCKVVEDKTTLLDEYLGKACGLREAIAKHGKEIDDCVSLTSARIDLLEFKGDSQSLEKALNLAAGLASEYDPIRKKYWLLRVDEMKQALK